MYSEERMLKKYGATVRDSLKDNQMYPSRSNVKLVVNNLGRTRLGIQKLLQSTHDTPDNGLNLADRFTAVISTPILEADEGNKSIEENVKGEYIF